MKELRIVESRWRKIQNKNELNSVNPNDQLLFRSFYCTGAECKYEVLARGDEKKF